MYRAAGVVALRDGISLEAARDQLHRAIERQHPDLHGARLLDAAGDEGQELLRAAQQLLAARGVGGELRPDDAECRERTPCFKCSAWISRPVPQAI